MAPKQILISVLFCLLLNPVFLYRYSVHNELWNVCLAPSADLINVPFFSSSRWLIKMLNKIELNTTITCGTLYPPPSKYIQMQSALVSVLGPFWYSQSMWQVSFPSHVGVCEPQVEASMGRKIPPWVAAPAPPTDLIQCCVKVTLIWISGTIQPTFF